MHINEKAKKIIDEIIINSIDIAICKIFKLDATANIVKQIIPNIKSPIALVDIADVDTFRRIFLGVNRYLSKFPVLM